MASFKLNIAKVRGCPPAGELAVAMESFALPETEEFGVLNCTGTAETVFATIIRKTQQAVQRLDAETAQVTAAAVEKVSVYPIGIRPESEVLEIYAGPASAIEQVGVFLGSCLALPTVTEPIEIDIPAAIEKVAGLTERFSPDRFESASTPTIRTWPARTRRNSWTRSTGWTS